MKISSRKNHSLLSFSILLPTIILIYMAWLVACWPGILGQDSLAIMLEVDTNRDFQAGKPVFWYMYNQLTYGTTGRTEVPIGIQLLLCAIICSRILSWTIGNKMWKIFFYSFFFVALGPSVIYYMGSLYSDGIYAICLSGMLFEIWRCSKQRKIDTSSILIFLITIPFALFARPNGIINLLPLVALAWILSSHERIKLATITIPWCILAIYGHATFKYNQTIGSIFPMALYETVGFLEHRPMGLWERNEPRVSTKTIEALTSTGKSVEYIQKFHDHYYWDPLIFVIPGPNLLSITKENKRIIVREFFKYNLWHNLPAFLSSRVNIFLYSSLANGGIPDIKANDQVLPRTKSISSTNIVQWSTSPYLVSWHEFSMRHRAILWAPWLGYILIFIGLRRSIKERDIPLGIVAITYGLQLAAVFIFSIAGEYRYLLAFFTASLVLLPILNSKNLENV